MPWSSAAQRSPWPSLARTSRLSTVKVMMLAMALRSEFNRRGLSQPALRVSLGQPLQRLLFRAELPGVVSLQCDDERIEEHGHQARGANDSDLLRPVAEDHARRPLEIVHHLPGHDRTLDMAQNQYFAPRSRYRVIRLLHQRHDFLWLHSAVVDVHDSLAVVLHPLPTPPLGFPKAAIRSFCYHDPS